MADSIEQRLITLVVTRMQGILTAKTYVDSNSDTVNFETNLGLKVEDSRNNWSELDDLDDGAISVSQGTATPVSDQSDDEQIYVVRELPVKIEVFLKRGLNPADGAALARLANKDIFAAIKQDRQWHDGDDPLAIRTDEVSNGPVYAQDTFELIGLQVIINIFYRTRSFTMD